MVLRYVILAIVMIAVGLAAAAGMIVILAFMLIRPKRMTDGRALAALRRLSPRDLGMEFETVSFQVIDESTGGKIKIAGWWIPTPEARGKSAIILHGYSDAKVGGIAWAPMLRSLGFNILALDLRAHGESGGSFTTAGFWERHDITQVIDQTKSERRAISSRWFFSASASAPPSPPPPPPSAPISPPSSSKAPSQIFTTPQRAMEPTSAPPAQCSRTPPIVWHNGSPRPTSTPSDP